MALGWYVREYSDTNYHCDKLRRLDYMLRLRSKPMRLRRQRKESRHYSNKWHWVALGWYVREYSDTKHSCNKSCRSERKVGSTSIAKLPVERNPSPWQSCSATRRHSSSREIHSSIVDLRQKYNKGSITNMTHWEADWKRCWCVHSCSDTKYYYRSQYYPPNMRLY